MSTAGLAASSTSAALAGWPECSIKCLTTAIGNSTCSATDQACMCTNEQLQLEMNVCVKQTCTIKELLTTVNLTMTSCGAPIRDKSDEYIILSNTFAVITGLFIVQRFASKIYWKLPLGLDDWFMLITFSFRHSELSHHRRDIWTLTPTEITNFGYYFHVMAILYFAQVTLLKLSLLFFYLRIFPTVGVRRTLWATCQPISYFWKKWDGEHEGHCADLNAITWSNAAISIALDFWMLAVPLSQLKALNLDWKKKIGVGMMFCVGTFVTIVSILRLRAVVRFKAETENATWEFLEVSKWSTIEINVGMICACMPSLRILLVRLFPKILGTSRRYYPNYASNTGRNTNKNRSRQLGTNATTEVDTTRRPVESRGITYQRTYDVQYGDNDETQLVDMKDLDGKSAKSGVSGVSV
ncbi:hypothetical protein CEP52_003302 [Fusarium oligoseptatum]|uniref:CFEM domain-containing protein n=1 Tax=Fusarium oligoseptatum TaxID=2604345 RepID=A0A428U952_9HYPO|nr:hypothetical protein CEP52_003302 [Fusarium oligoseptatum]